MAIEYEYESGDNILEFLGNMVMQGKIDTTNNKKYHLISEKIIFISNEFVIHPDKLMIKLKEIGFDVHLKCIVAKGNDISIYFDGKEE